MIMKYKTLNFSIITCNLCSGNNKKQENKINIWGEGCLNI